CARARQLIGQYTSILSGYRTKLTNGTEMSIDVETLRPLFAPRSIAIVGASATPGKIGAAPLSFLQKGEFAGAIYPVSSGKTEIAGLKAFSSVLEIDAPID